MPWRFIAGLVVACLAGSTAFASASYKIVTASERGTYIQIGRDLAKFIAPPADIELEALPSAGSAENVERLRYEPGVKFALVQSDVYQAFLDHAAGGNADADAMIRPLRVILPLYNEEIYFIARSDSPLNFVHEIKDAKINVGALRSGTAMSSTTIFRQMFGSAIPEGNASYLSNEEALVKLIGDKSIDVVVVVAGQPAKLLVDMKPEARQLIKLLKFDPNHPSSKAALRTYFNATVRAASYPNLLAEDIPSVAVKAFLVTYDYKLASTSDHLNRFARSLCQNFPRLREQGHPKWREVEIGLPELGRGWLYYPQTERALRACMANQPKVQPVRACTQQEKILGLCK
ncbi:TAXI family TRAP transporter solute-binding subunit [Piscinibacter sp. XHJ-5]|uniref:TAXI family TRAP transporter solute-binding subunit n=1 Tax=Piscinibacter sp. XHJ-5 TaxID=3037797 RepID=UPI00245345D9|nr:TAXI family TRAP transporter solute-binding subunit [Piscinibacter sp. XHJ-5]